MQPDNLLNEELKVSPDIETFLTESARWARFLSVVGLILSGLLVVLAFAMPAVIDSINSNDLSERLTEGSRAGITINFLIVAALVLFPCLILLRFSGEMKKAMEETNQEAFASAFSRLKSLFRFYGILTIIIIGLYVLAFLLYLIALAGTA